MLELGAGCYPPCGGELDEARVATHLAQLQERVEHDDVAARKPLLRELAAHLPVHRQPHSLVEIALLPAEFERLQDLRLLEAPLLFSGSQLVSAASILGVSIAFTGVLVPCVFLIVSRRSVVSEMLEDVTDIQSHLKRGRVHGLAIRRRRQISEARE